MKLDIPCKAGLTVGSQAWSSGALAGTLKQPLVSKHLGHP